MRSVRVRGGVRGGDEGAEKKDECKTINPDLDPMLRTNSLLSWYW